MTSTIRLIVLSALIAVFAVHFIGRAYDAATDPMRAKCQDGICVAPYQQP